MKGKLNKLDNGYVLLVDNIMYATDNDKLSKENCDEIFGVVDVEKLFLETPHTVEDEKDYWKIRAGYIEGFNKAMELNKDKVFTLEDMGKFWDFCINNKSSFWECLESLQQPTEIDVEIVTEPMNIDEIREQGKGFLNTNTDKPKFDSNGNLILKKP